jgi:hypothetical protein
MHDIKVNSIFFDLDRLVFCTVSEIKMMCNDRYINYIGLQHPLYQCDVFISDWSLLDKSKFIPVCSEEEKLVISLKYL